MRQGVAGDGSRADAPHTAPWQPAAAADQPITSQMQVNSNINSDNRHTYASTTNVQNPLNTDRQAGFAGGRRPQPNQGVGQGMMQTNTPAGAAVTNAYTSVNSTGQGTTVNVSDLPNIVNEVIRAMGNQSVNGRVGEARGRLNNTQTEIGGDGDGRGRVHQLMAQT